MKCRHYKGSGFGYRIGSTSLCLCEQCNLDLSQQVFGQVAISSLAPGLFFGDKEKVKKKGKKKGKRR